MTSLRIGLNVVSRDEGAERAVCRAAAFDEEAELVKLRTFGESTVWVGSETLRDAEAAEAAPEEADARCVDSAWVYDRTLGTIPRSVARRWREVIDMAYSYFAPPPGAAQVPVRAPVSVALSFSSSASGPGPGGPTPRDPEPETAQGSPRAAGSPGGAGPEDLSATSVAPAPTRPRRAVRFGRVHAREFARKIGGSGGVPRAGSWPLGLDWRVLRERELGSVDEVERERGAGRREPTPLFSALAGGKAGSGSPAPSSSSASPSPSAGAAGSPSGSSSPHTGAQGHRGGHNSPKRRKRDGKEAAAAAAASGDGGSAGAGALAAEAANALLPLSETERRVCILAHALDWRDAEEGQAAAAAGHGGRKAAGSPPTPPRSKSQVKRERGKRRRRRAERGNRRAGGADGSAGTPEEGHSPCSSSPGCFPVLEALPSPAAPEAPTVGVEEEVLRRVTTEHEVANLEVQQELEAVRQARAQSKHDAEEAEEEERLCKMSLNRLRDMCRAAGVDVRGSKGKLVQRLAKHCAEASRERAKASREERKARSPGAAREGAASG